MPDRETAALLVPAYNAEAFIADILADAAAQTQPFDEVLVYDDASTDATARLAASLGARVISGKENHGAAFARNRLIGACTSAWIHFHDADDRMAPDFLAVTMALARGRNANVLCAQQVRRRQTGEHVSIVDHAAIETDALGYFLRQVASFSSVGLYRTDDLRAVGGFDEGLRGNEDPDLHVRLARGGARFAWCADVLSTNLLRADSFSGSNWLRCMTDRLTCLESYESLGLEPRHLLQLGQAGLWTANQLWRRGETEAARRGLRLAQRCGIREIDSRHWLTRMASRVIGLEATFHARGLKDRLFS